MTHDRTLALLDDYVGDELDPATAESLRRHLAECAPCRAEEHALRALLEEAAALPAEIAPERDLWEGIAARLPGRPAPLVTPIAAPAPRRVHRPLPAWMKAAAVVALVVASSLVTLYFDRMGRAEPGRIAVDPTPAPAAQLALVAFEPVEAQYEMAIGELMDVLDAYRDELAPETVRTLEESLRVIDTAIADARAALAADPASPAHTRSLAEAYNAKLGLLRRAVQL